MTIPNETDRLRLLRGEVPLDAGLLASLTVGLDSLTGFLRRHYLEDYLPQGGSKIKFAVGRRGSGKSHFAACLLREAEALGYRTVCFSAGEVWLHDFRETYLGVLRRCSLEELLADCAAQIVRELGYDPADVGENRRFLDYLAEKGEGDALARGEIRSALRRAFTRNPLLDSSFAACCSLLVGDALGYPVLEPANRELLLAYLNGSKAVKPAQIRALGVTPSGVTRYNARNLLRSLSELVHLGGRPGLLLVIEDLELLLRRGGEGTLNYTKMRREDAYESIRQLIDDIDTMHHLMVLFCADRELLDNENYGMKSYQALWLRVQNEVVSTRFNRFADLIDLDRYADECYGPETLRAMSERLAQALGSFGREARPLTPEAIERARARGEYGGVGLPLLINRTVIEGGGEDA